MADADKKTALPKYVERIDLPEVFADLLESVVFDGTTLRMEFVVKRVDESAPKGERFATRTPVCRLVLPAAGFLDLHNKLNRLASTLEKQGILRKRGKEASLATADQAVKN